MAAHTEHRALTFSCPACRGALTGPVEQQTCSGCGRTFGAIDGVPLLIADAGVAAVDHRHDSQPLGRHDSAALGTPAIDEALA